MHRKLNDNSERCSAQGQRCDILTSFYFCCYNIAKYDRLECCWRWRERCLMRSKFCTIEKIFSAIITVQRSSRNFKFDRLNVWSINLHDLNREERNMRQALIIIYISLRTLNSTVLKQHLIWHLINLNRWTSERNIKHLREMRNRSERCWSWLWMLPNRLRHEFEENEFQNRNFSLNAQSFITVTFFSSAK